MGKVKKILAGVLVVVIAGSGITAGLMQLKKNSQKTVAVTPVSGLLQEFYTPSTTLDGTITSSATQTVNGDKDLIIDQIYVTKGDAVKKGDLMLEFDSKAIAAAGYDITTPVIISNSYAYQSVEMSTESAVRAGDALITVTKG